MLKDVKKIIDNCLLNRPIIKRKKEISIYRNKLFCGEFFGSLDPEACRPLNYVELKKH